jgi:hypothetical protein
MNGFISEDLYKKILQCLPIPYVDIARKQTQLISAEIRSPERK